MSKHDKQPSVWAMRNAELQGLRDDICLALQTARQNPYDPIAAKYRQEQHDSYWLEQYTRHQRGESVQAARPYVSIRPLNTVLTPNPMQYQALLTQSLYATQYLNNGGRLDHLRNVLDAMSQYPQRYRLTEYLIDYCNRAVRHESLHHVAVQSIDPSTPTRLGVSFRYENGQYGASGYMAHPDNLSLEDKLDVMTIPLDAGSPTDEVFYRIGESLYGQVYDREGWKKDPSIKRIRRQKNQPTSSTINIGAPTWEQIQTGAAWGMLFPPPLRPESA